MVRYVPLLADGHRVKLSWPLALFRLNHIYWPLDESTSLNRRRFDYFLALLGWGSLMLLNDSELRYLRYQTQNLDLLLTGVPTYVILVEGQLRIVHVLLHRAQLLEVLQKFFASIYVDPRREPIIYQRVERDLRLNRAVSALYLIAVTGYVLSPILMVVKGRKDFPFAMIPPFDVDSLYVFLALALNNVYSTLQIVTMVFGETALLCELMAHLKGRYRLLQRDLDVSVAKILEVRNRSLMAQQLREVLVQSIHQNVALNRFNAQLEQHFTVRIFIIFAFSAILLCALGFTTFMTPSSSFVIPIWFGAKTVELLSIGQLGSELAHVTDLQSSMYYQSQWEQVLYYSTNHRDNLRLMKVVALAIEILQGAFSYFTFLTSIR